MVSIADLKTYILEENMISTVLEALGCHHIKRKSGYYQCANPDGDNQTALCIYENENLTAVDYTRDIAHGHTSADIISVVQFFEDVSFPKAVYKICEWVGLDYYYDFEENLPKSILLTKELLAMQGEDGQEMDDKPVRPIPEKILSYYVKRVNQPFADDNISYLTQREWEVGFDQMTNRITIPIRDEIGTLVGVKGRLLDVSQVDPEEAKRAKYLYIEPCARNRILYGLYKTIDAIKSIGKVYVGEAEKSVMQMWNMGVYNCVATGGKKVTNYQIELLTRLCVDVIFLFDKDVQKDELLRLGDRFTIGTKVYAAYDDKGILADKQAPTDDPQKFQRMIQECIRRIH